MKLVQMDLDGFSWTAKVAGMSHLSCLRILLESNQFTSCVIWLASKSYLLRNKVNIKTLSTGTAWVSNRLALPCKQKDAFTWVEWTLTLMKFGSSKPSLAMWRRAEATPPCMMQPATAEQTWWSCCSRPMHRWTWKTRTAGGLSSDATRSGPSWRVTVYLEIGIHRSLQQKSHFVKTGVHIFRV